MRSLTWTEGGRPGNSTQAVRHTCSGNVKTAPHKQKSTVKNMFWQEDAPPPQANGALCLSTPKHNGKSGTVRVRSLAKQETCCKQ
jgi:hypothetical protein